MHDVAIEPLGSAGAAGGPREPDRTSVEISLSALLQNLEWLRSRCGREIIPVVKADAYGHGTVPIARALVERGGCRALAVATLDEALELRHNVAGCAVIVLSGFLPDRLDAYRRHRLTPVVFSLEHLRALAGRTDLPDVHLKVDTGMNRLGLRREQMGEALGLLEQLGIRLAGVATHLAESENADPTFTAQQLEAFDAWLAELRSRRLLAPQARVHAGNSAAILGERLGLTTAVRPGLALYGVAPGRGMAGTEELVPVLRWSARVIDVKELAPGDSVGYGRTYVAPARVRMATLSVGYADGYPRSASNRGHVLLGGERAPVIGTISMDLMAVDCSRIEGVRAGSRATLIGEDGALRLSAWDIAGWTETIAYEVLCGISARVTRVHSAASPGSGPACG